MIILVGSVCIGGALHVFSIIVKMLEIRWSNVVHDVCHCHGVSWSLVLSGCVS